MRSGIPWWWSVAAWGAMAAVTAVCLVPRPPGSPLPSDKLDHLAAFAVLAVLMSCGRRRPWIWVLGVGLWGGVIELGQGYTGRHGDLLDWYADLAGAALGGLLLALPPAGRLHRRWRPSPAGA
jgi:VanZ family protein